MTSTVFDPLASVPPPGQGTVCPKCLRRFEDGSALCADDQTPLVSESDVSSFDGDPMVGRTLDGRFTLLAKLGAGSMGTVYRARQHAVERDVAIKILRSDRANDETAKARFLREARANSLLASPHTVTVFDFGQSETGEFYLAMEMLEGESLGQRLYRLRRLPVDLAVETARQALRSLAEAHAKGIIHRDLKPDNLFYARVKHGQDDAQVEEIVKVLDFGIAKMIGTQEGVSLDAVETQAGTVFGTPRFMSPEQAQGKPLDARSDLYSLGVILYQMLTGRPPFTDNDAIVVMARHIKTVPRAPTEACPEASIPVDLETVLMRALAKDPKQRPASAEQMSSELARALDLDTAVTSGVRTVRPPPLVATPAQTPAVPPRPASPPPPAVDSSSVSVPPELMSSWRRPLVVLGIASTLAAAVITVVTMAYRWSTRAPVSSTTAAALAPSGATETSPALQPPPVDALRAGTAPATSSSSSVGGDDDGLTISAENLPKAPAPAPRPRTGSGSRQSVAKGSPSAPAGKPSAPTAPLPSSRYGIFE